MKTSPETTKLLSTRLTCVFEILNYLNARADKLYQSFSMCVVSSNSAAFKLLCHLRDCFNIHKMKKLQC